MADAHLAHHRNKQISLFGLPHCLTHCAPDYPDPGDQRHPHAGISFRLSTMARAHHSGASLRCSFGCDEILTIRKIASNLVRSWTAHPILLPARSPRLCAVRPAGRPSPSGMSVGSALNRLPAKQMLAVLGLSNSKAALAVAKVFQWNAGRSRRRRRVRRFEGRQLPQLTHRARLPRFHLWARSPKRFRSAHPPLQR